MSAMNEETTPVNQAGKYGFKGAITQHVQQTKNCETCKETGRCNWKSKKASVYKNESITDTVGVRIIRQGF